MLVAKSSSFKLSTVTLTLVMLPAVGVSSWGQEAPAKSAGVVDDWSHHHVVFSNPGTREDAVRNGTLDQWLKVTNSSRYQMQKVRRSSGARSVAIDQSSGAEAEAPFKAGTDTAAGSDALFKRAAKLGTNTGTPTHKDWSVPVGAGATATLTGKIGTLSSTTISSSSTVTIAGTTLTASPPTGQQGTLTLSDPNVAPPDGSSLVLGGITYSFTSSQNIPNNPGQTTCQLNINTVNAAMINLIGAISNGAAGNGAGKNTWECGNKVTGNSTITYVSNVNNSTTRQVTVAALVPGSTSKITTPTLGSTGFTWGGITAGTDGTTSDTTFAYWSGSAYATSAQVAANLATAVNLNTTLQGPMGASAVSSSNNLTLTYGSPGTAGNGKTAAATSFSAFTGGTFSGGSAAAKTGVQPNAFPAFYGASFTTVSCTNDFIVFPTGQPGSGTTATIVAFNNLYSSCTGGVPSVFWALNTNSGSPASSVTNSPVLSADGTEVAFIQSNGTTASLVVVKWAASPTDTIDSPSIPQLVTNITTCTAPCMTVTNLTSDDTYSAPFYDFLGSDSLYVGDDTGHLEKFTGVFNGTVAKQTPVNLGHANPLASPVLDGNSGCIFVGDTSGYLYSVNSGVPGTVCSSTSFSAKTTSGVLGNGANTGIFDGVLVDGSAGEVYAFVTASRSLTGTTGGSCAANSNCVAEYPTNFAAGGILPAVVQPVGTGGASYPLYSGTFDNVYYSASTPTGNLYVMGGTGTTSGANLYRIAIANGVMGTPVAARTNLTAARPWSSPLTEFCNNGASSCVASDTATTVGTDQLFFSLNEPRFSGCTTSPGNGCVLGFDISTPQSGVNFLGGLNVTTPDTDGCWASSAIVVDNAAGAGGSQIYFFNQNGVAAGGPNGQTSSNCTAGTPTSVNAVQASQSNPSQ
jgi:hypothetical protein